jgi:anti-sigma B factor antagonist
MTVDSDEAVARRRKRMTVMDISERRVGDVVVLSISGDITMSGGGTLLLAGTIRRLLQQGHKHLVLDLADVRYVESSGLGELVQSKTFAHHHGASLKLLHVGRRLANLLALTKLDLVLECFDDERDAVASFGDAGDAVGRDTEVNQS